MTFAASDIDLIGIDWGTTSFRAFLIGAGGRVLDRLHAPEGILHVPDGNFDAAFARLLEPRAEFRNRPIVASGMITSRNGWIETPYVQVPAGAAILADALVDHQTPNDETLSFVTGICAETSGAPDVMRGEETQIVGAAAAGLTDGIFVMPGTHSKWVVVTSSRIETYSTFMTGEVFDALSKHTILGTLMDEAPFDETGFRSGTMAGLNAGPGLLHRLLHVRTLPLFSKIEPSQASDYLSGLLIGAEIEAVTPSIDETEPVTIIGRDDLANRYEIALSIAGIKTRRAPSDIVALGHYSIAQSAGLIS